MVAIRTDFSSNQIRNKLFLGVAAIYSDACMIKNRMAVDFFIYTWPSSIQRAGGVFPSLFLFEANHV